MKIVKIVNLTPQIVRLPDGREFPACETPARNVESHQEVDFIEGVSMHEFVHGSTVNLPKPEEETYYIVSFDVAQANRKRMDLIVIFKVNSESVCSEFSCYHLHSPFRHGKAGLRVHIP